MVKVKDDLTGRVFGRLTVIKQVEDAIRPCGKHEPRWLCECSCEEHNMVIVEGIELKRNGRSGTQSCGCLQRETSAQRNKKSNIYDLSGEYGIGWTTNTNKEFYFDLEDYDKIKAYCWHERQGYAVAKNGKGHIQMHQLLGGKGYDHINRNRLDNCKSNLREAQHKENGKNRSRQKNNTSGVTGVGWHKKSNQWRSRIRVDGKNISLGFFTNKDDAIKARLEAEKKYFGEFAPQQHLYEQYGIK